MTMPGEYANRFAYHKPSTPEVGQQHDQVRNGVRGVAYFLWDLVPDCPERERMIDALDDAMKHANAGIARHQPAAASTESGAPVGGA